MSTNEYLISGVREHAKDRGWYPSRQECIDLADALEAVTVERDALAAQVREARDVSTSWSVPVGVTEAAHYMDLLTRVHQKLSEASSVAFDRVKAEAFAEGWAMRASRGYAHLKVGESVPLPGHVNPYWKGESNG